MKVTMTITIDHEVKEQIIGKYGRGETSQAIEDILKRDLQN